MNDQTSRPKTLSRLIAEEMLARGLVRLGIVKSEGTPSGTVDESSHSSKPSLPITTPNDRIAVAKILRISQLTAVGNWITSLLEKRLNQLQDGIVSEVRKVGAGSDFDRHNLEGLQADVAAKITSAFKQMSATASQEFYRLYGILAEKNAYDLMEHHSVVKEPVKAEAVLDTAVMGAPLKDHFDKMASDMIFRVNAALRTGIEAGDSTEDLVKRLLGESGTVKAGDTAGHEFHGNQHVKVDGSFGQPNGKHTPEGQKKLIQHLESETGSKFKPWGSVAKGKTSSNDVDIVEQPMTDDERSKANNEYMRQSAEMQEKLSRGEITHDEYMKWETEEPTEDPLHAAMKKAGYQPQKLMSFTGIDVVRYHRPESGHTVEIWREGDAGYDNMSSHDLQANYHSEDTFGMVRAGVLDVAINLLSDPALNSIDRVIQAAITAFCQQADGDTLDDLDDDVEQNIGWQWTCVADGHVCDTCAEYDGAQYTSDDEPVGNAPDLEFQPGSVHFGCRCGKIIVDLDATPAPNRHKMTFEDYLSQFSDKEQKQAFGAEAVSAYRRGDLSASELISKNENLMTLDDFKRA